MPKYKVPVSARCTVTGWVIVEAEDEEEAADKAVVEENFVKGIEPDLENVEGWEFVDDWDNIEELRENEEVH